MMGWAGQTTMLIRVWKDICVGKSSRGNIGTTPHSCDSASIYSSRFVALQSHSALWVSCWSHPLMITQIHGSRCSIGCIKGLDILHGQSLACSSTSPTTCSSVAQTRGRGKARWSGRATFQIGDCSCTSIHFLFLWGATEEKECYIKLEIKPMFPPLARIFTHSFFHSLYWKMHPNRDLKNEEKK